MTSQLKHSFQNNKYKAYNVTGHNTASGEKDKNALLVSQRSLHGLSETSLGTAVNSHPLTMRHISNTVLLTCIFSIPWIFAFLIGQDSEAGKSICGYKHTAPLEKTYRSQFLDRR